MLITFIFCSWVHPNIGNSVGEKILIGVVCCILLEVIYLLSSKYNEKVKQKENNASVLKTKEESEKIESDKYFKTLRDIASMGSEKISINYNETISQLKDKCNPKLFLECKDLGKLKKSAEIYSELIKLGDNYDRLQVRKLRKEANEILGIYLPSGKTYETLKKIFNPKNFIDENFDKENLIACQRASIFIDENKNDLRKLEQFAHKIGILEI